MTNTKPYVSVVTIWIQNNTELFQQLKSGFKKTINLNKYRSDPKTYPQNRYFSQLVDPSFQGVNRLFVLSFENEDDGRPHSNYYFLKAEIKYCNFMIDRKNFFDQIKNNDFKTYEQYYENCYWIAKEMIA